MKSLKTILKWVAVLAAIAGAAYALWHWFERRDEELDELDDYLMSDDEAEDEIPQAIEADEEYLDQDFQEWTSIPDGESITVSFLVNPSTAYIFQKALAETGYSSNYDKETRILETVLNGPKNREEIAEFEKLLKELLSTTESTYLGFAFE